LSQQLVLEAKFRSRLAFFVLQMNSVAVTNEARRAWRVSLAGARYE
jgi:hypothetical protein